MAKTKITKDTVPSDFTLKLAIVDAIPVLFFGASMIVVSLMFKSGLFLFGALLCLFAGAAKVLWKIIVVIRKKNIWWLFLQMRILMPAGMVLMLAAVIIKRTSVDFSAILSAATGFPSVVFFIAGVIGMVMMTVFAFKLDGSDVKVNWIEQLTNGIAQICIFIGLLATMISL